MNGCRVSARACAGAMSLAAALSCHAAAAYLELKAIDSDVNVPGDFEIGAISASGVLASAGGPWRAQIDARLDSYTLPGDRFWAVSGGAHVNYSGQDWVLGAYANASSVDGHGSFGFGVEGQVFAGPVAISASTGWTPVKNSVAEYWDSSVQVKYFATDRIVFAAAYKRLDGLHDGEYGNTIAVEAEYGLPDCGASVVLAYRNLDYDYGEGDLDVSAVDLSVRWALNGETPSRRERSAPGLTRGNALLNTGLLAP